jgi:hypothetical protein
MAGETVQYVDPAEIPANADVDMPGKALGQGRHGGLHELMANTAAYARAASGCGRARISPFRLADRPEERVIDVDRKVVEVGGSWDHTTRLWRLVEEAGRWP